MSEIPQPNPNEMTPQQVNDQINGYYVDASGQDTIGMYTSSYGGQRQIAGSGEQSGNTGKVLIDRNPQNDLSRLSIEVNGKLDGKETSARLQTWQVGDREPHLQQARTEQDGINHWVWADKAGVVRKTEDGKEYKHNFKDPAKLERAAKLITSLASKRADRMVPSEKPVERKIAA